MAAAPKRRRTVSLPSDQVLAAVQSAAAMHQRLEADGYKLGGTCRCHIHKSWDATVRLVWRRRATSESMTMSLVCPTARVDGRLVIGLQYVLEERKAWSISVSVRRVV